MPQTVTLTFTLPLAKAKLILDLLDDSPPMPAACSETMSRVEDDDDDDNEITGNITKKMEEEATLCRDWRHKHRFYQHEAAAYFSPDPDGNPIPSSSWCAFEDPAKHPNMVSPTGRVRRDRRRLDYVVARLKNLKR